MNPEATAIAAPGRRPLTFVQMVEQIGEVGAALAAAGIARQDRVALFLPSGPEAAMATLAVSLCAVAAPMDPQAGPGEIEHCLDDLAPRLLVFAGSERGELLLPLCSRRGISVWQMERQLTDPAGRFTLPCQGHEPLYSRIEAQSAEDLSLILATSGSTGQAKFVPLTHRNLAAAAANTRTFLALTPNDRSVNALPLFHGHGLVGGAMAPLSAGSAVMFTGTFAPASFMRALLEFRATWFTAVPAMHQSLIPEAAKSGEAVAKLPLRFLRTGSAPMPAKVKADLEYLFAAPLLNRYGLTEALQLVSESLDPARRKEGSLGICGLSQVRAMDPEGRLLAAGEVGEIVCRGPNVFAGYWQLPDVNAERFHSGWLRTGDTGYVDADGHLFLQGRVKDFINSGGEKVSPTEVETALSAHPGVRDAVVLAVPDELLGQAVAALIVARPEMPPTAAGLRAFVARHLSPAKVPRRFLFVEEIPRGPLGKPLRAEVAARYLADFAREAARPPKAPMDATAYRILAIWEQLLTHRPLGVDHDFFDCGGNSLTAARMVEQVNAACGSELHPVDLFEASTVQAISRLVKQSILGTKNVRSLVTVQPGDKARPHFVLVSGDFLGGGIYCHELARFLPPQQPFHYFPPFDLRIEGAPRTIEAHAKAYLKTVSSELGAGPFVFAGYSHGAYIALEMARLATKAGSDVRDVIVLDMIAPRPQLIWLRTLTDALIFWRGRDLEARMWRFRRVRMEIAYWRARMRGKPGPSRNADDLHGEDSPYLAALSQVSEERSYFQLGREYEKILRHYVPRPYRGRISVIAAAKGLAGFTHDPAIGWGKVASNIRTCRIPCSHFELVTHHISDLGDALTRFLAQNP